MSANRLLGLRCKGTTKFADMQIFEVKSENGVVSGKKAERSMLKVGRKDTSFGEKCKFAMKKLASLHFLHYLCKRFQKIAKQNDKPK
jgi:hypothetical protein